MGIAYDGRKPLSMDVANIFYFPEQKSMQIILDNETNEVVAMYRGDPVGAAAAFICLQYECSSSGKCHDFFYKQ